MLVEITYIIKDVRIAIDENTANLSSGSLLGDTDTLDLKDIIESKIEDGINAVKLIAPLRFLNIKSISSIKNKTVGLPDDFLRFVMVKDSSFATAGTGDTEGTVTPVTWRRPVTELIPSDDSRYSMQFSDFEGIRGNASKPVAVLTTSVVSGSWKKVLEFFPQPTNATLCYVSRTTMPSLAAYPEIVNPDVPQTVDPEEDSLAENLEALPLNQSSQIIRALDVEKGIYRAAVYKIAALVMATYKESGSVQLFNNLCLEQLGLNE